MQFSAIVNRFIVKIELNSALTNDLKRKENFSKIIIVAELVSLTWWKKYDFGWKKASSKRKTQG